MIIKNLADNIKKQYSAIPFANWDGQGLRPAPYAAGETYPEDHPYWQIASESDRIGIRLENLVLVDYDGNKPEAVGEIPSLATLATALGYDSQQEMYDKSLVQWNDEQTSMHFLFVRPDDFDLTQFKQSNQGTKEYFWKHIDIKTGNQLIYLKDKKTIRFLNRSDYDPVPAKVLDQLKVSSEKTLAEDFDFNHLASEHQQELATSWLHEQLAVLANMPADSGRNSMLNIIGCTAAGLVAGGALNNEATWQLLFESAITAGLDFSETTNTMHSAWREGFNTPRRDAPYQKPTEQASVVFNDHVINDTNVNVKDDSELTKTISQGHIDPLDPNAGVLHQQYTRLRDNWVMNKESRYIEVATLAEFSKTAFDTMHMKDMPVIPGSKQFKKFVPSTVFAACDPVVVSDLRYMPGKDKLYVEDGILYLNSYIPYEPRKPNDVEINKVRTLLYNHLSWLFDDVYHQRLVLDWLAWQVQHPGELVGWLPLVIGCRGDGKSTLFELVTAALGSRNTKSMTNNSVTSAFQNWATGACTTAFEEIKVESRYSRQVANDLKPYITEKRVTVNQKGKPELTVSNHTNYIAFSNEPDPIAIAAGDRRWCVLHTNHFGKNSVVERTQTDMKQHFDDIKDLVNNEKFHPAVHFALMEHEISEEFVNHRFRAPQTEFALELTEQTASEKENRLQEYLDNCVFNDNSGRKGKIIDYPYGFQIRDFRDMMPENWFSGMDKKPSRIMLGKWLRNLGYELATRRGPQGELIKTFKK